MKKYSIADIADIIMIPVIAYLFIGLIILSLFDMSVNTITFVLCATLVGVIMGISRVASNRAITYGIIIYGLLVMLWLGFFLKEIGPVLALTLAISTFGIYLLCLLMRNKIIKIIIGYVAVSSLIIGSFMQQQYGKGVIVLAIILLLISVSETIGLFYEGKTRSLAAIYILIAVLTLIMPVSEKPYDWAFVFQIINSVEGFVNRVVTEIQYHFMSDGNEGFFRFGTTGYSDSDRTLSSSLIERDIEQLILQGDSTKRNMYLKGNISNVYTTTGWEFDVENVQDYRIDTLMTLYAIFEQEEDVTYLRRFMDVKQQTVHFQNIRTQSLFYPLKLLSITAEDTVQEADRVSAGKTNERGYTYSYEFVDIDYANATIVDILKNSGDIEYKEESYERIYELLEQYYDVSMEKIPYSEFLESVSKLQEDVKAQYLMLNGKSAGNDVALQSVSERVFKLASEIANASSSDYEICKRLEKYLYQYKYNMKIDIPKDANILDWFLFEGREGYCMHYSTALAVMLRVKEVPARFVEGFLVDYKDVIDSQTYSISSDRAHAWVEAYIQGFGWIRLEPTVVNAGNANTVWYETEGVDEEDLKEDVPALESDDENDGKDEDKERLDKTTWSILLPLIGGMIVFLVLIVIILIIYRKIQIARSNNPDVVLANLMMNLGKNYLPRENSETIGEYFARLEQSELLPNELENKLPTIRNVIEEYCYGNGTISTQEIKMIKELEIKQKVTVQSQF